ncbi:MAG: methylaspartate mutase sigma subunit [Granulosicoccus sp.]|jgi:methylaspartate mutase sigma subunit
MREKCTKRGVSDMTLYVGGNVVIGKKDFADIKLLFINKGYDRFFARSDAIKSCCKQRMAWRWEGVLSM